MGRCLAPGARVPGVTLRAAHVALSAARAGSTESVNGFQARSIELRPGLAARRPSELLPPEADIGHRIAKHCQDRGLIVRPLGHLNVLSPPLVLTREQIDDIVAVLRESIAAAEDDLVRASLWRG